MNTFTPGPWEFESYFKKTIRTKPRSFGSQGGIAGIVIAELAPAMTSEEKESNGYLLAAAPELLAACKRALAESIGQPSRRISPEGLEIIRNALKKAEGG